MSTHDVPRPGDTPAESPESPLAGPPDAGSGPALGPASLSDAEATATVRDAVLSLLAALDRPPTSVKIHAAGVDLEVSWAPPPAPVIAAPVAVPYTAPGTVPVVAAPSATAATVTTEDVDHIHAPTVGVFYGRPDPSAEPYVVEGDIVTAGQQIGIIEAMKLMIPVTSDRGGRICAVLVTDGDAVQFGEPLFALVPTDG